MRGVKMSGPSRQINVYPDPIDLRDRMYSPTLKALPRELNSRPFDDRNLVAGIKDQGQTMACTGFALACLVERLQTIARTYEEPVSPYMLFFFARKYDELSTDDPTAGSTARGAMRAWHKHGACALKYWKSERFWDLDPWLPYPDRPDAYVRTEPPLFQREWVQDAFFRPLGAYYRVDHTSIPDMHAALTETGAIYVTSKVHSGWDKPRDGQIYLPDQTSESDGVVRGHAYLIVGYDEHGFWIQNSWGPDWGMRGFARLTYMDWQANGMDAWVGQLGVHISRATDQLPAGLTAPVAGRVSVLSSDSSVAAQEVNPYIVDLENNGRLSSSGKFRTAPHDLLDLVSNYLLSERSQYEHNGKIDVALYAHGGLVDEAAAEDTAKCWVPALHAAGVFPVFFMWETGWQQVLKYMIEEFFGIDSRPAAGAFWDKLTDWKDDRIEQLCSALGTASWDEIKENAAQATRNPDGGIRILYEAFRERAEEVKDRLRFHLIGHSAGANFHAHLLQPMLQAGFHVDGIYLMAPAIRVDLFDQIVRPCFGNHGVNCYTQFQLSERQEQDDNCHPLPYNRSLLYLVSNACEHKKQTPILGMQRYSDAAKQNRPADIATWDFITSCQDRNQDGFLSQSTSHGGFDEDAATRNEILNRIKARM